MAQPSLVHFALCKGGNWAGWSPGRLDQRVSTRLPTPLLSVCLMNARLRVTCEVKSLEFKKGRSAALKLKLRQVGRSKGQGLERSWSAKEATRKMQPERSSVEPDSSGTLDEISESTRQRQHSERCGEIQPPSGHWPRRQPESTTTWHNSATTRVVGQIFHHPQVPHSNAGKRSIPHTTSPVCISTFATTSVLKYTYRAGMSTLSVLLLFFADVFSLCSLAFYVWTYSLRNEIVWNSFELPSKYFKIGSSGILVNWPTVSEDTSTFFATLWVRKVRSFALKHRKSLAGCLPVLFWWS